MQIFRCSHVALTKGAPSPAGYTATATGRAGTRNGDIIERGNYEHLELKLIEPSEEKKRNQFGSQL